jgi:ferredoxin
MGPEIFEIRPERCTECVGHFEEPQCREVCPVDCIITHPDHHESREQLEEKYRGLTAAG